jgi:hypothetical protein
LRHRTGVSVLVLAVLFAVNAGSALAATPPVNTVLPSLSGTAQDGKALTVAKGTWTGTAPITYTYQWQESSNAGLTWTDIAGATSTTYTPPAGFAGKQVHAVVTATNAAGSAQATSPPSAVILLGPPVNTVAPTLSGTAQDGVAMTVAKGTWTGGATITYAYQWQFTIDVGLTWNDIAGATSTSYTPPAGWAGRQLRAVVTGTNADGTSQALSLASAVILANPPVNTVAPSLSGTAQDGVAMTVAKGTWTGMATITYAYQWQVSTDGALTWSNIAGAISTSYTPPAGSVGKQVRAVVTATNGDGSAQATSPASAVILANPPVNTVAPSLSGTAQDGVAMTVAKGTWTGMATITYAYQWQVSTDGALTWSNIAGATGTSYTPPAGWAGRQVRATVTATNGDGSTQATTTASAVILANPPLNTVAPTLSGTAQDGKALTVAKGTWTGVATIVYTYQWQVTTDGGATWNDIAGATSTSYTPPAGWAGRQVRAVVTATNGDGSAQATSPASAVILANPPVNTVAPTLGGTAQDGKAITVAKGTWTGIATIVYTYQWQVTTDGGATWNDIVGATGTSYTPPAGWAGRQVRAVVTATNGDGNAQATSPASAVILANPAVNTVAPTLSGTAQDGVAMTAAKGTWTGIATITYAYQWQVSPDGGLTWTDISGATGTTYTPPAGFAGRQVRVVVTGTNGDGSSQASSAASAAILANLPVNTVAPALSGTAQDGQVLTASAGTWTGMATITFTYQWQVSTDGGSTWNDITGETGSTYTPPAGFAGRQVRVVVTGTNGDGSSQASSAASAAILANLPVNTVAPALSGTAQDGQVLTASAGTWTGMATITFTYQWQVSTDGGSTWNDITGETGSTYTPPAGFAGKQVRVLVTASNGDGSSQALSSASAAILPNLPVNTVAPDISGTAQDAQPLTASAGTWTGLATITYAYQWQVSTDGGSTWNDIAGETGASYTPPLGSAGKQARVMVTATNGDGSTQSASAPSAALAASPPVDATAPVLSGTAQNGHSLSTDDGSWTGPGTLSFAYQWQVSTDGGVTWTDIPGANASSYALAGLAGKRVRALVSATNADGSTQAASAPSGAILAQPPPPPPPPPASPAPAPAPPAEPAPAEPGVEVQSTPPTQPKPKPKAKKPTHAKKKQAKKTKKKHAPNPWRQLPSGKR